MLNTACYIVQRFGVRKCSCASSVSNTRSTQFIVVILTAVYQLIRAAIAFPRDLPRYSLLKGSRWDKLSALSVGKPLNTVVIYCSVFFSSAVLILVLVLV